MHKALIAVAALAFCSASSATRGIAADTTARALPVALTIHIKDFTFNPTPATVHAGDRVAFVNDDDEAHTATSSDKSFDSQGLDGGGTWKHVFAKPGIYSYYCELHPYMKAKIIVLPAPAGAANKNAP